MFALFVLIIVITFVCSIIWGCISSTKAERSREWEARRAAEAAAARQALQTEKNRQRKAEAAERREQREMEAAERREEAVRRYEKKIEQREAAAAKREARQQEAQAKADAAKRRQEAAAAKREADRAAKVAAARELAELRERELVAARELRQLQRQEQPASRPETVSNVDDKPAAKAPEMAAPDAGKPFQKPAPVTLEAFAAAHAKALEPVKAAPGPFAGQVVSFTGKLSMPRRVAVEMVQNAGGRAYADMPAGTTLLVVGDNPGMKKMDKADRWIGQVKKVTEKQFLDMFPA